MQQPPYFFFSYQEENKKKQLKVKIQMAKFLQDTVEEMAVTAKEKKTQEVVGDFANFFEKVKHVMCTRYPEQWLHDCIAVTLSYYKTH